MDRRKLEENIFKGISYLAGIISGLILILIIGKIAWAGIPYINWYFLLTSENETPGIGGAIGNSIVGTFVLSILATVLASPLAVGLAVYMKRYAKNRPFIKLVDFCVEVMSGTPSIVLGALGILILVFYLRYYTGGFSLISGAIALSLLILPVIERAAEQAIDRVPKELEEASYALGANKWETIIKITLPFALSGIITGIVLGIGRAAEESTIVIMTAGYSIHMLSFKIVPNEALINGMKVYPFQALLATLPITIYNSYHYPTMVDQGEGFAAALVLIAIVMFINLGTRLLLRRRRIG